MDKKDIKALEHYERIFTLSMWRKKAYLKWRENRYSTEWSKNFIKRFKYCLHEWRWWAFQTNSTWSGNTKHWIGVYIGLTK